MGQARVRQGWGTSVRARGREDARGQAGRRSRRGVNTPGGGNAQGHSGQGRVRLCESRQCVKLCEQARPRVHAVG